MNQKNGAFYSVRDSETMTAEELMDNIRDRIQKLLIENPGQNRKFVHPESKISKSCKIKCMSHGQINSKR